MCWLSFSKWPLVVVPNLSHPPTVHRSGGQWHPWARDSQGSYVANPAKDGASTTMQRVPFPLLMLIEQCRAENPSCRPTAAQAKGSFRAWRRQMV